ncbi:MAG: 2-oxo acid dehydrogenase subunit E2 [Gammaproteobacteria bacterium]|nr:2-oxo acid dehydrogenase subunit E2 [Gammaproteobacteria bacterium]
MPTEIYLVKAGMTMSEGMVEEWCIPDGGKVKTGQLLYRMETEKINLDVEAEASGTVKHLVGTGVPCKPGQVIGYIYGANETIPDDVGGGGGGAEAAAEQPAAAAAPEAEPAAARAPAAPTEGEGGRLLSSPAARRLAGELSVDITRLSGTGPGGRIVEADVQAAADAGEATAPAAVARSSAEPAAAASADAASASPLARRIAAELGVDLSRVAGSGPNGRITRADVEAAAKSPAKAVAAPGPQPGDRVPVKGIRKTTATRMFDSLQTTAQLTMDMEVEMDEAVKLRELLVAEWKDEGIRPSYTDMVILAVAKALRRHPMVNSEFGDSEIVLHEDVHVGMAVAVEAGLLVPVIRHADSRGIKGLAMESKRLAEAARDNKLGLDDFAGGTFTVSALGMFGVDSFTPILNAPQVGILGVNRIYDGVGWDGDTPVKRKRMRLSLTWDHRVVDGAPAAQFLGTIRDLLEAPYRLLI